MGYFEKSQNEPITPSEIVIALLSVAWTALGPIIALKVGGVL